MRFLATAQIVFYLAIFAIVAFVAFRLFRFFDRDMGDIGLDLKENTPFGIPARAIDAGISAATGKDETLGGWLAEIFSPTVRAANKAVIEPVAARRVKPINPYEINPRMRN